MISVVLVDVSDDLKYAKIYLSIYNNDDIDLIIKSFKKVFINFSGYENYIIKKILKKVENKKKLIPMNRLGKLDEYNSVVLFLASESSSYITGSTVVIDGGRTIW